MKLINLLHYVRHLTALYLLRAPKNFLEFNRKCCFVKNYHTLSVNIEVNDEICRPALVNPFLGCPTHSTSKEYRGDNLNARLAYTIVVDGQPKESQLYSPYTHAK